MSRIDRESEDLQRWAERVVATLVEECRSCSRTFPWANIVIVDYDKCEYMCAACAGGEIRELRDRENIEAKEPTQ